MSRTHVLAEKRTAGGGKSAKRAEDGVVGGGDLGAEIAPLGRAVDAAGGSGAPLAIVRNFGAIQGVAGGTAAAAASATSSGMATVAGGDAADGMAFAAAATAGGDMPAATPSAPAGVGGDTTL